MRLKVEAARHRAAAYDYDPAPTARKR